MNRRNGSKINHLLKIWPQGTVATSSWLKRQGISKQLVDTYRKTDWLQRLYRGAFIRSGDQVDWTGGLYALQEQLGLPVHAAGKTALEIQGYSHFLPLGKEKPVFLFGKPKRLPSWFQRHHWDVRIHYVSCGMLGYNKDLGFSEKKLASYSVRISSPERAIMEVAYLVPRHASFEETLLLMEGLSTLRPPLVQRLLEQCRSVKGKRLFMFLAEACGHAWVKAIDLSKIEFGKGKRVIGEGGHYNAKYEISVPKKN